MDKTLCILLAAYNGEEFIREQIASIRDQVYTDWDLFINIDRSTDETLEIVTEFSEEDPRIIILKSDEKFGSAGKNFYDLILTAPIENYKYIAFSDQDDIWDSKKLSKGINCLINSDYAGYSSSVTAMFPSGDERYINKSGPQRLVDYKFESAGPGCTYIITFDVASLVRQVISANSIIRYQFYYHDWLVYYVARNAGLQWYIDPVSYIRYRQHNNNDTGANLGLTAALKRLHLFRSGWYFDQVYLLEDTLSRSIPLNSLMGERDGLRIRWLFMFINTRRVIKHAFFLGFCVLLRIVK